MKTQSRKVWVTGRYPSNKYIYNNPRAQWEITGIFTSEKKALAAVRTNRCFVGPLVLNNAEFKARVKWEGARYIR